MWYTQVLYMHLVSWNIPRVDLTKFSKSKVMKFMMLKSSLYLWICDVKGLASTINLRLQVSPSVIHDLKPQKHKFTLGIRKIVISVLEHFQLLRTLTYSVKHIINKYLLSFFSFKLYILYFTFSIYDKILTCII